MCSVHFKHSSFLEKKIIWRKIVFFLKNLKKAKIEDTMDAIDEFEFLLLDVARTQNFLEYRHTQV